MHVTLGPASRTAGGQTISFGTRTFRTLRITIAGTNLTGTSYAIRSRAAPVGLAEVGVDGVQAQRDPRHAHATSWPRPGPSPRATSSCSS